MLGPGLVRNVHLARPFAAQLPRLVGCASRGLFLASSALIARPLPRTAGFSTSALVFREPPRGRSGMSSRRQQRISRSEKSDKEKSEKKEKPKTVNEPKEKDEPNEEPEQKEPEQNEPEQNEKPDKPKPIEFEINLTQVMWGIFGLILISSLLSSGESLPDISYQEFKTQYLNKGLVEKLNCVNGSVVLVFTRGNEKPQACFSIGSVESLERRLKEAQDELGIASQDRVGITYSEAGSMISGLFGLLPTVLFLGFLLWIGKNTAQRGGGAGGGFFGIGKTKAHLHNAKENLNVRFADVAGMDEAKQEIMEFVQFLKNPQKYEKLGAKIPRGAILSGAPGTGKTLLAKATAGEAGVPFYAVSGSEFVEMFSGVGASRVRDLFKKAKEKAPSMIWIDEIDAIGKSRTGANIRGGNDEREATLNQLLVEMDGFGSNTHVVVLAGTNRADVLDKALLRPGRFDRHIIIDLPTLEGRKDIYKVHLSKINYDKNIEELPGKLSAMTPGFSGADIANCCNEAALAAAREEATIIEMRHFEAAVDRVIAGLERRSRVLPANKRKIVAYHEAGHAVAGWFLKHADPLIKVTIIPHGSAALGYAQLLPNDNHLVSQQRMEDLMTVALGGRVSEEIFFKSVTVGASDDFKRVTGIAKAMVCEYGMSPKVGAIHLDRRPGSVAKGYASGMDALIDTEVKQIIDHRHQVCVDLLTSKREQVKSVAEELLAKEVLTRQDLVRLLGPRPYRENEHEAFRKYLDVN